MGWFKYCKRNSLSQIAADFREYKGLKGQLRQAQKDLEYSLHLLTKEYDIEDDINRGDSCLKHKKIIEAKNIFKEPVGRYVLSRCQCFVPIDNERLCANYECVCWPNNNRYHQDLNQVKQLSEALSMFWSNKFAKVK